MGKHPYKYGKTPPGDPWDPPMGALGPPMGSQGGPLGTHGAMDPGLWGPMGQGTHWPRTRASGDLGPQGPGASGDPGPRKNK